jgi:tRNA modification GTPase
MSEKGAVTDDTIVALASGRLPAGVAVIRISGPSAFEGAATLAAPLPAPRVAALRVLKLPDGSVLDTGLVVCFPAPASFTGEDVVELHLHGGRAVVARALRALATLPQTRLAEPGEYTLRAVRNGRMSLLQAEALIDTIDAETEAQRVFATSNARGDHATLYEGWRRRLITMRAAMEAEIDFSDEGDVPDRLSDTIAVDLTVLAREIDDHLGSYRVSEIIRDGFEVVLLGPPNVGKSSLVNRLARRDVAIVTDEPGTTRDLIHVELDLDGYKVRITDTAGIRVPGGKVEALGIERSIAQARQADLILLLTDGSQAVKAVEGVDAVVVGTKSDVFNGVYPGSLDLTISAHTGYGIDHLLGLIADRVRNAVVKASETVPWTARHRRLLFEAVEAVAEARQSSDVPLELRSEALRVASVRLQALIGAIDVEDLLDEVFSRFCIGK